MLRSVIAILALVLVAPTVAAAPILTIGVGPHGLTDGGQDGFYLRVNLSAPEAPRDAHPHERCGHDPTRPERQAPPLEVALLLAIGKIANWRPNPENPTVTEWYPVCVDGTVGHQTNLFRGHVAYHFPSGRYFVALDTAPTLGTSGMALWTPLPAFTIATVSATGTTGIGTEADCEFCPPPGSV